MSNIVPRHNNVLTFTYQNLYKTRNFKFLETNRFFIHVYEIIKMTIYYKIGRSTFISVHDETCVHQ